MDNQTLLGIYHLESLSIREALPFLIDFKERLIHVGAYVYCYSHVSLDEGLHNAYFYIAEKLMEKKLITKLTGVITDGK